jgi:D-alanyl-D-alanine carboxypeptidase (penicillin-binding protein 5/6)
VIFPQLARRAAVVLALTPVLCGHAFAAPPPAANSPTTPKSNSKFCVLEDASTGKMMWAKNENVHRPIASTTKMMTAILLLERGNPDDIVTAPQGVQTLPDSSLHLSPGETIPLHDMMYALMLRSANDTAVAGATYLSGSVPAFVEQMNLKAQDIGAFNTHFVTPNGLYAPDHYSTAADLATIARYATNNLPEFNKIVRTPKYKVQRSMHKGDSWVTNTSKTFLRDFPGADGIKTGYVRQAGHCFVGSATRGGWRLIAVALKSNTCRQDVESLLNYGFANYKRVPYLHQGDSVGQIAVRNADRPVPVVAAKDLQVVVSKWKSVPDFSVTVTPLPSPPSAPIAAGTKLGTYAVIANGKVQATGDAVAGEDAPMAAAAAIAHTTHNLGTRIARGLGAGLGAVMLLCMGVMVYGRTSPKGIGWGRNRIEKSVRRVD